MCTRSPLAETDATFGRFSIVSPTFYGRIKLNKRINFDANDVVVGTRHVTRNTSFKEMIIIIIIRCVVASCLVDALIDLYLRCGYTDFSSLNGLDSRSVDYDLCCIIQSTIGALVTGVTNFSGVIFAPTAALFALAKKNGTGTYSTLAHTNGNWF